MPRARSFTWAAFVGLAGLFATPAAAGNVPIDYALSITGNGKTVSIGTMILDYDGSTYSLDSLELTLPKKSAIVTSDVTLAPQGGSDYCLYTFASCTVVPQENSLFFIFDPSLTSQTTTLFGYSTDNHDTESLALSVDQTSVPEPATWALMLLGLGVIGASLRRRSPTYAID